MQTSEAQPSQASLFAMILRTIGLIVLLVGVYWGLKIINEAWSFYKNPAKIEKYVEIVEQATDANKFSASVCRFLHKALSQNMSNLSSFKVGGREVQVKRKQGELPPLHPIKLSYFSTWCLLIILWLVIGRIAFLAITTGGKLTIYNADVERTAKAMVKQIMLEIRKS